MFESQHNSSLPPAVFGRLVGGEDILAKIERVPVDPATNRPLKPVTLKDVAIFADPYDAYKKKLEKRIVREQEEREGAGIKAAKKAERDGDRTTCASLRGGCNDADWRFWGEQVVRNRLEQAGADGVGAGGRDGGGSGQVPWSGDDGGTEEKGGTCGSWNPEEEAEGRGRVRRVLGLVILQRLCYSLTTMNCEHYDILCSFFSPPNQVAIHRSVGVSTRSVLTHGRAQPTAFRSRESLRSRARHRRCEEVLVNKRVLEKVVLRRPNVSSRRRQTSRRRRTRGVITTQVCEGTSSQSATAPVISILKAHEESLGMHPSRKSAVRSCRTKVCQSDSHEEVRKRRTLSA